MIYRGEPTRLYFKTGFDITNMNELEIIFSQRDDVKLTKHLEDVTITVPTQGIMELWLSGEETDLFRANVNLNIQLILRVNNSDPIISNKIITDIDETLEERDEE